MNGLPASTRQFIDELVRSTGADSPEEAIRGKARELIQKLEATFGCQMPVDVNVLASLQGIHGSNDLPIQSPDAELVPRSEGGVEMRVHPDRPETRQRFSIAHEITHTFFPDYEQKGWCRTDARFRNREDPDQYLEMLCDIGAAELLFPQPWFGNDAASVSDASGLVSLATTYHASREATVRRFVETATEAIAAVYFVWKLKPTQKKTIGRKDQMNLLGITPEDEVREALRLRIEYTIPSECFRSAGHYLPNDKSIESAGPIYEAALTGQPCDGECFLELGQSAGTYNIMAVPLWTEETQRGSKGENMVAAVLKPMDVRKPSKKRKTPEPGRSLFDDL